MRWIACHSVDARERLSVVFAVCTLMSAVVTPARAQDFEPVIDPEKTDVLVLRNGDTILGDFRQLERGMVTFKTDAAATIYVKWPRVVTATTTKVFEIDLADGRVFIGSVAPGDSPYRISIRSAADTTEVPAGSIVKMTRIKKTWFERLDGSADAGFSFTQQNAKVDLNGAIVVNYNIAFNRFALQFNGTYSRQDSVSPVQRRNLTGLYYRELKNLWLWASDASWLRNSQLGLENAVTVGTGPGRYLVRTEAVHLGTWIGLYVRSERYVDQDSRRTVPLALTTDLQWFTWSGLSTDVSSRLVIAPILNDSGRWQITFTANLRRELLSLLYLNVGLQETYDSKPPADVNQNDFAFTTSIGWTF